MRRLRDYDAELKALDDKAAWLRERKVQQLGQLMIATGADTLPVEELAGALLAAIATTDPATREAWRAAGAAFFCSAAPVRAGERDPAKPGSGTSADSGGQPAAARTRAS